MTFESIPDMVKNSHPSHKPVYFKTKDGTPIVDCDKCGKILWENGIENPVALRCGIYEPGY